MSNENTSHTPLFTKKSVPHYDALSFPSLWHSLLQSSFWTVAKMPCGKNGKQDGDTEWRIYYLTFPSWFLIKKKGNGLPSPLFAFPHHLLQCGPLQASRSSPLLSGTPQTPRSPFSPMGQSCTFSSCGGLSPPSYAAKPPTTPPASSAAASIVFFHIRTPSFKAKAYSYIYIYLL